MKTLGFFAAGFWFAAHSYASTQVDISEPLRTQILEWAKATIRPEDLYFEGDREIDSGFELDPHITVRYGLSSPDVAKVQEVIAQHRWGQAIIGAPALFERDGKPDVLYLAIDSPDLHALNEALSSVPHVDTTDDYTPHLTIAYLQKGAGQKYLGNPPFPGQVVVFENVMLSSVDGEKTPCPLTPANQPDGVGDADPIAVYGSESNGVVTFSCCGVLQTSATDTTREGTINGEPYIEKLALLFECGTYEIGYMEAGKWVTKTVTYTTDHLDKMAASVIKRACQDEDWDVPVLLDHERERPQGSQVGNVREAFRRGERLWGWLRVAGAANVAQVRACNWRKLSIGHNEAFGLSEVSFTPFPRILVAQVFTQTKTPKEDPPVAEPTTKEAAQPQTTPPAANPAATPANFVDAAALEAKLRAEFAEKAQREQAASDARFAALEAQNAAIIEHNAQMAKTMRFAALTSQVEQFAASGLTSPAMLQPELAFMESLDDTQLAAYSALKAVQPPVVDLNVYSRAKDPVKPGEDAAKAAASEIAKKRKAERLMGGK